MSHTQEAAEWILHKLYINLDQFGSELSTDLPEPSDENGGDNTDSNDQHSNDIQSGNENNQTNNIQTGNENDAENSDENSDESENDSYDDYDEIEIVYSPSPRSDTAGAA